jgi:hypothetical protein
MDSLANPPQLVVPEPASPKWASELEKMTYFSMIFSLTVRHGRVRRYWLARMGKDRKNGHPVKDDRGNAITKN